MIELHEFSVGYQKFPFAPVKWVLKSLNARFESGLNFLVSPNGSGKSTLLKGIAGRNVAVSGVVHLNDARLDAARQERLVGYCPQDFSLPRGLVLRDYLEFLAYLGGAKSGEVSLHASSVLGRVGLSDLAGNKLGTLSGGQKRRVGIAHAIMFDRPVLLLDEPTVGLDEHARHQVRELIKSLGFERTVLLSTHIPDDALAMGGKVLRMTPSGVEESS